VPNPAFVKTRSTYMTGSIVERLEPKTNDMEKCAFGIDTCELFHMLWKLREKLEVFSSQHISNVKRESPGVKSIDVLRLMLDGSGN
jgi:hypothetical protein